MTARYLLGDTRDVLATLEPASVDLVLSSPPFFALRSYLPGDDPAKASEIGAEETPGAFIDTLLDVAEACARVLTPHGSLVFELGDTYASAGGTTDNRSASNGGNDFAPRGRRVSGSGAPLDKSLCLIPELFRLSLAYGRNPLTGRETDRWRVRNVVRWWRPNPPVGALGDKWRPATSDMVIACKSPRRYWDDLATRTEHSVDPATMRGNGYSKGHPEGRPGHESMPRNPYGAPLQDTWRVPTHPYSGAHYATWPPALCVAPILAMCPERVCTTCGEPSRPIIETETRDKRGELLSDNYRASGVSQRTMRDKYEHLLSDKATPSMVRHVTAHSWTDCGHDTWRRGVVLDPFAGTGTTLAVAEGHGRDSVGIDLDRRNADLARERVGMFLEIAETVP